MNELLKKWKNLKIENLDNESELKRRLKVYCLKEYEEDAIIDDKHLLMEFKNLKDNNRLSQLF
jgi:hypothetical protein